MTQPLVTMGRATPTSTVDFDLSLEGPAFKVSRQQATIQLTNEGEFLLHNRGRKAIYVDGKALVFDKTVRLYHNQILEVSCVYCQYILFVSWLSECVQVASMSFLVILNAQLVASNKT